MQEPKIEKLEEGKFYTNDFSFNSIFTVKNGEIHEWLIAQKKWQTLNIGHGLLFSLANQQAIEFTLNQKGLREVENPEKKEPENKGNELQLSLVDFSITEFGNGIEVGAGGHDILMTYANSKDIAIKWDKALSTLMRLKAHPLARKPIDDQQFFLLPLITQNAVAIISGVSLYDKIGNLSPMFDCVSNAQYAINDIGDGTIFEMFKTFSGIYE